MPTITNSTDYSAKPTAGAVSGTQSNTMPTSALSGLQALALQNGWSQDQWDAVYGSISNAFSLAGALSWAQLAATSNYQQGNLANQQQQNASQSQNQQLQMAYQNMSDAQRFQLELQMGNGNLALGQQRLAMELQRLGADTALGQGQLALSKEQLAAQEADRARQLALDTELGRGQLNLGRANAILNAPRGPADFYAYTAKMGDLGNSGLLGGFLGNLLQQQTGKSVQDLAAGPTTTNAQLANALVTGQGAAAIPSYLTGGVGGAAPNGAAPIENPGVFPGLVWNPSKQMYDALPPAQGGPFNAASMAPIGNPGSGAPVIVNNTAPGAPNYVPNPLLQGTGLGLGSGGMFTGNGQSGIHALAEGTYNVPQDEPAIVHQGEMVVPAPIAAQVRAQPGVPTAGPIMPGLQGGMASNTTAAPAPSSPTNAELAQGVVNAGAGQPVSEAASNFLQKSIGVAPPTAASTAATSSTTNPTAPNVTSGDVQGLMTPDEIAQGIVLSPEEIARRQAQQAITTPAPFSLPATYTPNANFSQGMFMNLQQLLAKEAGGGALTPEEQQSKGVLLGQYQRVYAAAPAPTVAPTTPTTPTTPAPAWTPGFQTSAQDWKLLTPTAQSLYMGAQQETGGETPDDFLHAMLKNMPTFAKSAQAGLG